jgi:aminoglycoside phosphotransferase (APT) family kinase protein
MARKTADTIQVRKGEELNIPLLEKFLRENIAGIPEEKLTIEQFGAGKSNLTYCLQIGDWEAVLRRPPLGPVAPKAHDMQREFRILNELNPIFSLAPQPILFSNDHSIIGSTFFLMERKKGVVLDTEFPNNIQPTAEIGKRLSEIMVEQLVKLHEIDYIQTKLTEISRPEGFMERQVHGWISRYERAKTDEVVGVERLQKWLVKNIPSSQTPTVIHYDYKLNNAMFSEDLSKMVGLFDWEMTTVGDPLADLGSAMSYWTQADDPELLKTGLGEPPVTVFDGFLTRKEFIELYAKKSGREVSNMNFYLTFAYFKLAVIGQQIYYRHKKGQTSDQRFAKFDQFVKSLIQHAINIANEKR